MDYLTGKRKPSQALRFIGMLPSSSATVAQITAADRPGGKKVEPWRAVYAEREVDVLRDLWNLTASVNTPKGKKPPRYPSPLKRG